MKYFEKHPMLLVVVGIVGCGLAGVFVKLSAAPSAMTAAVRLLWTVLLLSPVTLGSRSFRQELLSVSKKDALLSALSGLFLAVHLLYGLSPCAILPSPYPLPYAAQRWSGSHLASVLY